MRESIRSGQIQRKVFASSEQLDDEPSEQEWLREAANSSAFDFLSDPAENVYTPNDGRPIDAEE